MENINDKNKQQCAIHNVVVNVAVCEHKNEDWKCDESGVDMYCTKCKDSEVELCDVCGSDDIIEAPSMGRNCNSCNPI